ncbi:unnamed protein product [Rotaria socialis]|nr:unnamed protein product [Rotaria socialis]CAF3497186.1 unnamed protein product [Rotaria socialis]CAF4170224.1 unnamed protein product [Rotaria socialis]CAF4485455.1 unnamed protein product [Rotaria socialis]
MRVDFLSNEIFHEIFKHPSMIDLVRTFRGLPIRLDERALHHLQINTNVDLRSAPTQGVNMYCSKFLPRLVDRVESFYLSNHHHAQNQIDQFSKVDSLYANLLV